MGGVIVGNLDIRGEVPSIICESISSNIPFQFVNIDLSVVSPQQVHHPCDQSPICTTEGSNKELISPRPVEGGMSKGMDYL